MRMQYDMPQFKHLKGGSKKLPDAPLNYTPAGGTAAPSGKRGDTKSMPTTPSTTKRAMRQDTGMKKMRSYG